MYFLIFCLSPGRTGPRIQTENDCKGCQDSATVKKGQNLTQERRSILGMAIPNSYTQDLPGESEEKTC